MHTETDTSRMRRDIHPMPGYITTALAERGVTDAYNARPAYQQNHYVGWITSPKRQETRHKRLSQMLGELETGGVYMRMKWNG